MKNLKVFANLLYALFTAFWPLLLKLNTIICSLTDYKPVVRSIIKKKQRAAIEFIITLKTKHFFHRETKQLA